YKTNQLKKTRPVTVEANRMPLQDFLQEILKDQPLGFTIEVNTIYIKKRQSFPPSAQSGEQMDIVEPPPPIDLRGSVTNQRGEPLEGVSVIIRGTNRGTTTDAAGRFQLTVPDNESAVELEFSYIGYERQVIKK